MESDALVAALAMLDPAERIAFVLHDVFAVPVPDIAAALGLSPAATRDLAARGRRHVRAAFDLGILPGA